MHRKGWFKIICRQKNFIFFHELNWTYKKVFVLSWKRDPWWGPHNHRFFWIGMIWLFCEASRCILFFFCVRLSSLIYPGISFEGKSREGTWNSRIEQKQTRFSTGLALGLRNAIITTSNVGRILASRDVHRKMSRPAARVPRAHGKMDFRLNPFHTVYFSLVFDAVLIHMQLVVCNDCRAILVCFQLK